MRELQFGWVLAAPTGTNAAAYIAQITAALDLVQDRFESVWVGHHLQFDGAPLLECTTTIASFARAYPTLRFAGFLCQS